MASEEKKRKGINSFMYNGGMKSKKGLKGIKRLDYYTPSDRQQIKKEIRKGLEDVRD